MISLLPRCRGLGGSQEWTLTLVATVRLLCPAISGSRSTVSVLHVATGRNVDDPAVTAVFVLAIAMGLVPLFGGGHRIRPSLR